MNRKPRLLVLNPTCLEIVEEHREWIESEGVELIADPSFQGADATRIGTLLQQADAAILPASVRATPTEAQMADAPDLLVCSIAASGFDWFDAEAATRHGIVGCFAPGHEGAEVVADLTWGLMLAVARQIPHHHRLICEGDHRRGMGISVFGKTLGIVGLGHIGRAVARRARGFEMQVLASTRRPDDPFLREHGIRHVSMEELLRESDFVSIHQRFFPENVGMLGAAALARMKPTAILLNTARREFVDETALADAILQKRIAGAGLDDSPGPAGKVLLGLPNVVFTPHLGNRAIEGVHSVFRAAVQNALTALRGGRPRRIVNPAVFDTPLRTNPFADSPWRPLTSASERFS